MGLAHTDKYIVAGVGRFQETNAALMRLQRHFGCFCSCRLLETDDGLLLPPERADSLAEIQSSSKKKTLQRGTVDNGNALF